MEQHLGWVHALVSIGRFFQECNGDHGEDAPKRNLQMNHLDLDSCTPCCGVCAQTRKTLQIRRSTYREVVRVDDIKRLINLDGVFPYRINGDTVVFLRPRQKTRPPTGQNQFFRCHKCKRCLSRTLAYKFCSLRCKLDYECDIVDDDTAPSVSTDSTESIRGRVSGTHVCRVSAGRVAKRKGVARRSPAE